MRTHICFSVVVALVLSVVSDPLRGGGTNTVYTYGASFNRKIPADPAATKGWMRDVVVTVPDHVTLCDVDVFVSIRHTAAFDLQLCLQGPSGAIVILSVSDPLEGYYEGENYIATTFDDEADAEIAGARPPFAGSFRPLESLAVFDGQDGYGDWSLQVYDCYYANTGCLDFFALIITGSLSEPAIAIPVPPAAGLALASLALIGVPRVLRTVRRPSRGLLALACS